jgi:hypothetical protein
MNILDHDSTAGARETTFEKRLVNAERVAQEREISCKEAIGYQLVA